MKKLLAVLLVVASLSLTACSSTSPSGATSEKKTDSKELIVYTGRKESTIKPVIDAFAAKTGIKVTIKGGKTGGLINEIEQEKANPIADIFISTAAGSVEAVSEKDLFASYVSPGSEKIPADQKSSKGTWTAISGRARVILYNTNLVKDAPKSILELTDPKYKGKIAIAGTVERTTLSQLAYLIDFMGEAKAKEFVENLKKNELKILPDNSDVRKGVASGEFALGITNSPNYYIAKQEGAPVGVVYPDQGEGQMGTLVNPNTASIVKGTKHMAEAKQFIDFMLSPEAQSLLNKDGYEIPVIPGVAAGDVKTLADFRGAKISQEKLGALEKKAQELFPGF